MSALPELLAVALRAAQELCPHLRAVAVVIEFDHDGPVRVPLPPAGMASAVATATQTPFVPTDSQERVLDALEGRALTTDALIARSGVDRSTLYQRPGGIHELRDHGLVDHRNRLGYFRPDCPPAELEPDR